MTKKIELRKVSYNASLSEETSAYTAQVWVDGVHLCDVSNHGTGGCDMHHPAKGKTHKDVEALNDYIKATYPKRDTGMMLEGKPFIMEEDLETVCGDLLSKYLRERDLKRLLARTIAFYDPAKKRILMFKTCRDEAGRRQLCDHALKKHPDAKILNMMPFDEALKLYTEAA